MTSGGIINLIGAIAIQAACIARMLQLINGPRPRDTPVTVMLYGGLMLLTFLAVTMVAALADGATP